MNTNGSNSVTAYLSRLSSTAREIRYGLGTSRLPLVSIAGIMCAVIATALFRDQARATASLSTPASPPFIRTVSGAGLVEPKSELVAVGAHLPGIVTKIFVGAGESVHKGAALFQIDDRPYQALKAVREGELQLALAQQEEANALWQMALNIKDPRAMSADERIRRHNRAQVAAAQVATARASLKVVQTDLERLVVQAPADGEILKVNIREGEAVGSGVAAEAPIMMGDLSELHVRVDIDENDAARFNPENNARGFIRGASAASIPLRLVRVEPLVIPKRSLTGASGERIDTRVLQAIYALENPRGRVSVGQQMDIFIEADPETPQERAHEADPQGPTVP